MNKLEEKSFYCPFCGRKTLPYSKFANGRNMCTLCGSLERHRILYYIYKSEFLDSVKRLDILHFAPEKSIYNTIKKNQNLNYLCCDLDPSRYSYVDKIDQQDGMNLTYKNETFDYVIHNHVLEHVPNDKKFIKETLRVLKPNGKLIVCFPYFKEKDSLEIETTSDEERRELYGQEDHVRRYGKDFLSKLEDPEYHVNIINYHSLISDEQIHLMKSETDMDMFVEIIKAI